MKNQVGEFFMGEYVMEELCVERSHNIGVAQKSL